MIEITEHAPALQAQVLALILTIQRDEYGFEITAQDQPDLLDVPGFYQVGAGGFWVARDGGDVVGTIALHDLGGGRGALRKMFVRASHRGAGHGVAQRLLETLLQAAAARGLHEVVLGTTDRFLAAHRFYEKHGFAPMPASELPPGFQRMAVDTRFYRKAVPPAVP